MPARQRLAGVETAQVSLAQPDDHLVADDDRSAGPVEKRSARARALSPVGVGAALPAREDPAVLVASPGGQLPGMVLLELPIRKTAEAA
jgi:hypothetical protein